MDATVPIAVVSVFLVSVVFSMFGQGGGSLYTPILLLLGYTASISVSTSLTLNLITALIATFVYYRGGLVNGRLALAFIPGIVVGAFLGGALGNFVDSRILLWLLVAFLAVAGARMVSTYWETGRPEDAGQRSLTRNLVLIIVLFSFAVGVLSGMLGVGGGILIVPFLIFVLKVPTKISAGVAAFVVVFSSLFGVLGRSAFGSLDATLVLLTAFAVAAGALIGARLMIRAKTGLVKVGFGLIMWFFAAQIAWKLL